MPYPHADADLDAMLRCYRRVAAELPVVLARAGVPWRVEVEGDESGLRATLVRPPALRIGLTLTGEAPEGAPPRERAPWWEPATEAHAEFLVRTLAARLHVAYRRYHGRAPLP